MFDLNVQQEGKKGYTIFIKGRKKKIVEANINHCVSPKIKGQEWERERKTHEREKRKSYVRI